MMASIFSLVSLRGALVFSSNVPVAFSIRIFFYRMMSLSVSRQLYFRCKGVFDGRLLAKTDKTDSFLSRLHYLQKREALHAERRL